MKKFIILGLLLILILLAIFLFRNYQENEIVVDSFESCLVQGFPVLESYPRQCKTPEGKTFVEDIGNELEKINLIRVESPRPNQIISSPLVIKGEARGIWFFEADFPIRLYDANKKEISFAIARAKSDWMTEDFVSFEAILEFPASATQKGILVFEKDNPSGLSEIYDELRVPVEFTEINK